MNSILIETLLEEPDLPQVLDRIHQLYDEEQQRRLQAREDLEEESYEFINGKIYKKMSDLLEHNEVQLLLAQLLNAHVMKNNPGKIGIDTLRVSLTRNDYEPDICFWNIEKSSVFKPEQSVFPTPDLVVEILSKSTAKRDRNVKFLDYAAHDIFEYWIISPKKKILEQYQLHHGEYKSMATAGIDQMIKSLTVKGFKIPVRAIFDEKANLETLIQILTQA
jgi:Uma2 family endonuclease